VVDGGVEGAGRVRAAVFVFGGQLAEGVVNVEARPGGAGLFDAVAAEVAGGDAEGRLAVVGVVGPAGVVDAIGGGDEGLRLAEIGGGVGFGWNGAIAVAVVSEAATPLGVDRGVVPPFPGWAVWG